MISDKYVWFIWSLSFLAGWILIYLLYPKQRKIMLPTSLLTALLGLTEPIFVPEYWSPPSLFDLALRTGFDIESLIFSFAIGGIGTVLYNLITGRVAHPLEEKEKRAPIHRRHLLAIVSPFAAFPILFFLPWNPIYAGIVSLLIGAIATIICRPDLKIKIWLGGLLFLIFYIIIFSGMQLTAPGYVEKVWNFKVLTGIRLLGIPLEEWLFAISFGAYWSGVYEHFTWTRPLAKMKPNDVM